MSAEESVRGLHAKIDALVAELAVLDPTGQAAERWCDGLIELHDGALRGARKKQFGNASFVAPIEAGQPSRHKPIAAGFLANIKS